MDRNSAASLARSLMSQHGLGHVPFEFDRGKRRLGATHFLRHDPTNPIKITLSQHYIELLPEAEIRDVLLHEIAHAKAGHRAGHGPVWRAHARAVGAKAQRCATPSATPKGSIQGRCRNGHTVELHRLPQRVQGCPHCGRTFNWDNRLTLYRNGREIPFEEMTQKYRAEYNRMLIRFGKLFA